MKIGIYKLTNIINGKSYIGQSTNIERRWSDYKSLCCTSQPLIYNALKKYGIKNFTFEILEECKKEELNERERYYIKKYNSFGENGYNLTSGGEQNKLQGKKLSYSEVQEIRLKLRQTRLTLKEIGDLYGVNDDTIGLINTGAAWYEDDVEYPIRSKTLTHERPIYQIDIKTKEILKYFNSIADAAKELKLDAANIGLVCNCKRNSAGNYWFCFCENYENTIDILDTYKIGKNGKWYKGKYKSENKLNTNGKIVLQYTINGELIKEYPSIMEAYRQTGIYHIGDCCRGERGVAGGYIWKYKNN